MLLYQPSLPVSQVRPARLAEVRLGRRVGVGRTRHALEELLLGPSPREEGASIA